MTTKTSAKLLAATAALTGFAAYVAAIPPSEQDHFIGLLVAIFPVGWRGELGALSRFVCALCSFASVYAAAHSGPQTPPSNPPQ